MINLIKNNFSKTLNLIFIIILSAFSLFKFKRKSPKISIFLPIFNKEKYIEKCIQSIQNQTLKDLEIIAVDDDSSDKTLQKLITLAKEDKRIKIVKNDKNHGLLYSRAMGILNSSGEYLMNIDPDDFLHGNDSLEYLKNQTIINNVDIITFDVYNKRTNKIFKCEKENIIQKQPKLFYSLFRENNIIRDYLIWNKLIKKEIYLKAYEFLKKEIYNGKWNYFEDDIWNILVNKYAKSKLCVNRLIYIYNYNEDSLMSTRFGIIEFQNILYRHEIYKKIFKSKQNEKYLKAEYFYLLNRLKWEIKY